MMMTFWAPQTVNPGDSIGPIEIEVLLSDENRDRELASIEMDCGFDGMLPDPIFEADLMARLECLERDAAGMHEKKRVKVALTHRCGE